MFDERLNQTEDKAGNKRAVYADSAYCSEAQEQRLADTLMDSHICEKGDRGKPLTKEQKESNREGQIQSTHSSRTCLWCLGANEWSSDEYYQPTAGQGENWPVEFINASQKKRVSLHIFRLLQTIPWCNFKQKQHSRRGNCKTK